MMLTQYEYCLRLIGDRGMSARTWALRWQVTREGFCAIQQEAEELLAEIGQQRHKIKRLLRRDLYFHRDRALLCGVQVEFVEVSEFAALYWEGHEIGCVRVNLAPPPVRAMRERKCGRCGEGGLSRKGYYAHMDECVGQAVGAG